MRVFKRLPLGLAALASPILACGDDTDGVSREETELVDVVEKALAASDYDRPVLLKIGGSGKCLDADPAGIGANGSTIRLWDCAGGKNQQWIPKSDGTWRNAANGRCLDAYLPTVNSNGGKVYLYDCKNDPANDRNQRWRQDGLTLRLDLNGKCLDAHGPDVNTNGGKIQLWDCGSQTNQQWTMVAAPALTSPLSSSPPVEAAPPPRTTLNGTSEAGVEAIDACWINFENPDEYTVNPYSSEQRLKNFIDCLQKRGLPFDALSDHYVQLVNLYCTNTLTGQSDAGIGWHFREYQGCMRLYGVEPSVLTVAPDYAHRVYRSCWGEYEVLERVLTEILVAGLGLVMGGPTKFVSGMKFAEDVAKKVTRTEITNSIMNGMMSLGQANIQKESIVYSAPQLSSFFDLMNPTFLFDIPPRALTDYAGYKSCLQERVIPGLSFKTPAQVFADTGSYDIYKAWAERVRTYCFDSFVPDRGSEHAAYKYEWKASDYKKCLTDREYPSDGTAVSMSVPTADEAVFDAANQACEDHFYGDALNTAACLTKIGVPVSKSAELTAAVKAHCEGSYYTGGKFADYNAYWGCYAKYGFTFSNDASWQAGVKSYCADSNVQIGRLNGYHVCLDQRSVGWDDGYWTSKVATYCDSSYYNGGKYSDYNPYWTCFTERGTTFINNADWQNGVRSYCADSNMLYGRLNGYHVCLDQRKVSWDDNYWRTRVATHCDNSYYNGGKYSDYNPYWTCFTERGTTYINNADWQSGVRSYCASSNAGIGYNGNITCLNERQVSYSASEWCPAVGNYCRGQSYPFAWAGFTEARCRSERGC